MPENGERPTTTIWGAWRDPIEVSILLFGGWLAAGSFAGWASAVV